MSLRPQEFRGNRECIPEVRESFPSPSQFNDTAFYGRESLAERPQEEGSIQSVDNMTLSTPFSAQSTQGQVCRQIPISNYCGVTTPNGNVNTAQVNETGVHLAPNFPVLRVRQGNSYSQQPVDTQTTDFEDENLADPDGDGPGDTVGLTVYSMNKTITNIETLDNSLKAKNAGSRGLESPSTRQNK